MTRSLRMVFVGAASLCVTIAVLIAAGIGEVRKDAWAFAEAEGRNLTASLAREIGRTVESFDLSLQAAAENATLPGFAEASPEMRRAVIFDRAANAHGMRSVLVLDAEGRVVMSSRPGGSSTHRYADREYFRHHRQDPSPALHVGTPLRGRSSGYWGITFSRRISGPEGEFAGVVVGLFDLAIWREMFQALELTERSTVTLLRNDGRVLLRTPFFEEDLGRDLRNGTAFQSMLRRPHGQVVASAAIDGVERLFTFQHIGGRPLIVTTALSTGDVTQRWQHQTRLIVAAGVAAGLLLVTMAVALAFELRRRAGAERALVSANDQLQHDAYTDPLTELPNRRAFDHRLDEEWRRAARDGTPLSLLVIDVDHFKRFNDAFGHPVGDECLKRVAAALRSVARRPGDLAARVGGEEFVLLMPDTDEDGGRHLAHRVGQAVRAANVAHPTNGQHGIVTVSIGGTSACPRPDGTETARDMLTAADEALYAAKANGRAQAAWSPYVFADEHRHVPAA
ncbi:MAG: sensor domain-containing diguanylate cyclase [Acetobacteraceae bacterium]|nr:sensor domain-containing diguanylate cyclase [Acetobacteraceae bacterium]